MTDVRGARIVRLIEDPEVSGDLLLLGVGLAAKLDFGLDVGDFTFSTLGGRLWSSFTGDLSVWKTREAFRRDMRTYRPPGFGGRTCTAPMVRRSGECGKGASSSGYLTDWATGEMRPVVACSRHRSWFWDLTAANRAERPDSPPLPCANYGGALVPHFPRIDWRKFWRRLDPSWVEHPETKPWPKPDLTILLGDAEDTSAAVGVRPILVAVQPGEPS